MADYGARGWPRTVGHDPHSTRGKCWSHHSARCVRWQMTGPGGGLGLWATTLINTGEMLVSSFCTSRPRDATRRMSATELVLRSSVAAATPSQQQLRRSSSSVAAAAPSQQHYNLALKWSSNRRVPGGAAGSTSRRDAVAPRGGTRAARSISSVAAASAPSQQQQQATAVSRDDERSTGLFFRIVPTLEVPLPQQAITSNMNMNMNIINARC